MQRRNFLTLASLPFAARAAEKDYAKAVPAYEKPLFHLHQQIKAPVKIASIDYLRAGRSTFVRAVSSDGVAGIVRTKEIDDFVPILLKRVIPALTGKDARDL
jgi:hypothetical protein